MINEIIIIGGGSSIANGISLGLKDHIKDKFIIAINDAYKDFDSTFISFVDADFYKRELNNLNKYPLIIGNNQQQENFKDIKLPNTYLLKSTSNYNRDILKYGCYTRGNLTGIWSITLALWLMDFKGILYILGYDFSKRTPEQIKNKEFVSYHYYSKDEKEKSEQIHPGGNWYERNNPDDIFKPFLQEKAVKVYNVSPDSNINTFEKISYEQFFKQMSNLTYNQENFRLEIKEKLCCTK
jgi:hypothetical protein